MGISYELKPATLERDEGGEDRWTLNFGPQHPATHTTLRLLFELEGERIVSCVQDIGFLHSGFEKLGEHHNYNQYVVVTDRMNYVSPIANNVAWHGTCEKLFGIEITPRCKVIRTIVAELARIQDHLVCAACTGLDLGGLTAFLYGFNARETLYDLLEELCGHRFTTAYTRVGGLAQDAPPGWFDRVLSYVCNDVEPALRDVETLLVRNRIFVERVKGVGVVSHDDAISFGMTGPMARGSGVRRDVRKDEPYLCYADNWDGQGAPAVEFKVPVAHGGDILGRFLVRVEEIRQSCKIIEQLAQRVPDGPINVLADDKLTLPGKQEIYFSIEGLIHHFEKIMSNRGYRPPIGEAYAANETPNGELGFYIISDGGNSPYRVRVRPPCFMNYQAFAKTIVGHQISDVPAVLNSFNVIAAELDR